MIQIFGSLPQKSSLIQSVQATLAALGEIVAPSYCADCSKFAPNGWSCESCNQQAEYWTESWCPVCAVPAGHRHTMGCHALARDVKVSSEKKLPWLDLRPLGRYSSVIRSACLIAKKSHGSWISDQMIRSWWKLHGQWAEGIGPCWIVPIPRHWSRRFLEGYDPAAFLCSRLAQRWQSTGGSQASMLRRTKATPYLSGLTVEDRLKVTQNLFDVTKSATRQLRKMSTVVLVDDILTTGATAISASRSLRSAGAKQIYLATMARTLEHES